MELKQKRNTNQKIDYHIDFGKNNYTHEDSLPHARVSPILQKRIRLILRYFSFLDLNFCNMYRISDWQCMYFLLRITKIRHELPFPDQAFVGHPPPPTTTPQKYMCMCIPASVSVNITKMWGSVVFSCMTQLMFLPLSFSLTPNVNDIAPTLPDFVCLIVLFLTNPLHWYLINYLILTYQSINFWLYFLKYWW